MSIWDVPGTKEEVGFWASDDASAVMTHWCLPLVKQEVTDYDASGCVGVTGLSRLEMAPLQVNTPLWVRCGVQVYKHACLLVTDGGPMHPSRWSYYVMYV